MELTIALSIFIFSIFLHELGHAVYMQKYGIAIKTFSIGLPFRWKITWNTPKILNGATLQFTPLFFLGAYVEPTKEGDTAIKELPYYQQADIYGAGPLANFLFTAFTLAILFFCVNIIKGTGVDVLTAFTDQRVLMSIGAFLILYIGRNVFSRYLMPILGTMLLMATMWFVFKDPLNSMVGPIGIVKMASSVSTDYPRAIFFGAILSSAIGATNILPLVPFDGGQSMVALLKEKVSKRASHIFAAITWRLFLMLIIFVIVMDVFKLF